MAPVMLILLLAGAPPGGSPVDAPPGLQQPPAPEPPAPSPSPEPSPQPSPQPATPDAPQAAPPPPTKSVPPAGPPPPHTGIKATLKAIPGDFGHLPTRRNAAILAGGGLLALAVHQWDDDLNAHLKGKQFAHYFFWPGKVIGQAPVLVGISLGTYAWGRATDNRLVSHLGMDLLRSAAVAGGLTYAIKLSVRRDRPSGECCSFPSGHASGTFAFASVLWTHLGWKAAVPTYTVATYVAMSRLHENVHFLSDVVFGSAVGIVSGRAVTRRGRRYWELVPAPAPGGGAGVMLVVTSR
ncbi:MAG: hypothetical protein DMF80_19390 [Acidobacteria bacterium]|nr:MAG: hypothetical protein DMF80_19390 [Acidobacteriota bacterium]